jgi:hypothetical protein
VTQTKQPPANPGRFTLNAADTLYTVVFKKGLPYAKKGIEGGLDLSVE